MNLAAKLLAEIYIESTTQLTSVCVYTNQSQSKLPAGPVEVDLDMPAVKQLWPEFCKIVRTTNAVMLPFLELFGAVDGNGVSPFARNFENPNDLIAAINNFL